MAVKSCLEGQGWLQVGIQDGWLCERFGESLGERFIDRYVGRSEYRLKYRLGERFGDRWGKRFDRKLVISWVGGLVRC